MAKRGDAAWREAKQRISDRNDEARKAGKRQRAEFDKRKNFVRPGSNTR